MKNIFLLLLPLCIAASASQSEFFSTLDSALAGYYRQDATTPAISTDTLTPEWLHFVARGDSAMAAAICSEQIAHAQPGTSDYATMAEYLDDYYEAGSNEETLLFRMMDTETRNLKAGYPDPVRLARISELLVSQNPQRAADCNQLAIAALLNRQRETDGIDWISHLSQLRSNNERTGLITILFTAFLSLVIGAIAAVVAMRRRCRHAGLDTAEPGNFLKPDTGTKAMLALALSAFAQTKELNLLVDRKLTVGQSKDLYNSISSGKIIGEASDKFFASFDHAIHSLKPTFIDDVNALLVPEKQFVRSDDGKLIPELRLAALIHMDITDSNRLSEILGLSLNTIYTYRNRLKGRAINRNTFEHNLKNI